MRCRMKERELTRSYPLRTTTRMTCPHCVNRVPYGARVCVGCQAEIRYGNTGLAAFLAVGAALIPGFAAQRLLSKSFEFVSTLVFATVAVWLFVALRRYFAADVRFTRRYRR